MPYQKAKFSKPEKKPITLDMLANAAGHPRQYAELYNQLIAQLGPDGAAAMQQQAYMLMGRSYLPNTLMTALCDRGWERYITGSRSADVVGPQSSSLIGTDRAVIAKVAPLAEAVVVALAEVGLPIRDEDAPWDSPVWRNGGVTVEPAHGDESDSAESGANCGVDVYWAQHERRELCRDGKAEDPEVPPATYWRAFIEIAQIMDKAIGDVLGALGFTLIPLERGHLVTAAPEGAPGLNAPATNI